ncbi:MAG: hypothetical protein AB1813_20635 [Verrucomicrobiota bacterium]|jgi:hypothetical protein
MQRSLLLCTKCNATLAEEFTHASSVQVCHSCRSQIEVEIFPALYRQFSPGQKGETIVADEASCFYHLEKKAVIPCEICGRFLCALCDIELDGQHLCPGCLESGRRKGTLAHFDDRRVLWDNCALGTAVLPILMWPITFVTAPMSIFMAIRYWKAPLSLIPRTRIRFVLAIIIATAQIIAWAAGITALFIY